MKWQAPDALLELASDDEDLLKELVEAFIHDTEERLARLRSALNGGNDAQVRAEAHAIRGSCVQMGAPEMVAICEAIERPVAGGPPAAVLVGRLEEAYRELRRAMKAEE